ncbi:MAG TPA: hypothetical protein DIW17_11920 [Clostridiales bacterium]|nr:hypothetical protein [Clostridiales bacterium]
MKNVYNIYPAFSNNNIAVYLSSSDLYAPYAGVFIQSLIENASSSNNYDILILETDISDQNKEILMQMVGKYQNISLRFVNISMIIGRYTFQVSGHYSKYTFYRLTAPEVLPNYEKIIYVDSDLVVNCDIAELFNIDLKENFVAATRCIGMIASYMRIPKRKEYVDTILKLTKPTWYFNAGVMLLNLFLIRSRYSTEYLLNMASSEKWMFCDQCILNVLFEGNIMYLPLKWNVLSHSLNLHNEKYLPQELFDEYLQARRTPKISHFAGDNLPIKKPTVDMYQYFWKYARNTPYYELLLSRMDDEIIKKSIKDINIKNRKADVPIAVIQDKLSWRQRIKEALKPVVNILLPKGTKRREISKRVLKSCKFQNESWMVL